MFVQLYLHSKTEEEKILMQVPIHSLSKSLQAAEVPWYISAHTCEVKVPLSSEIPDGVWLWGLLLLACFTWRGRWSSCGQCIKVTVLSLFFVENHCLCSPCSLGRTSSGQGATLMRSGGVKVEAGPTPWLSTRLRLATSEKMCVVLMFACFSLGLVLSTSTSCTEWTLLRISWRQKFYSPHFLLREPVTLESLYLTLFHVINSWTAQKKGNV